MSSIVSNSNRTITLWIHSSILCYWYCLTVIIPMGMRVKNVSCANILCWHCASCPALKVQKRNQPLGNFNKTKLIYRNLVWSVTSNNLSCFGRLEVQLIIAHHQRRAVRDLPLIECRVSWFIGFSLPIKPNLCNSVVIGTAVRTSAGEIINRTNANMCGGE